MQIIIYLIWNKRLRFYLQKILLPFWPSNTFLLAHWTPACLRASLVVYHGLLFVFHLFKQYNYLTSLCFIRSLTCSWICFPNRTAVLQRPKMPFLSNSPSKEKALSSQFQKNGQEKHAHDLIKYSKTQIHTHTHSHALQQTLILLRIMHPTENFRNQFR